MSTVCIETYDEQYKNEVQELFNELQGYLVEIDNLKVQTLSSLYRENYLEYVVKTVSKYDGKILIAKNLDENKVAGLVVGIIESKDEEDRLCNRCPKRGIILELIVSKAQRNAGCGGLLMSTIEEYFKEKQCEFSVVNVFAPNQMAKDFYHKLSYADRNIEMCKPLNNEE